MSMPASRKLADFRPRIWIKKIVACEPYAIRMHQAPVIHQVGAHTREVRGGCSVPNDIAREAMRGLIDANDEMVGKLRCQVQCRQTDATAGIQNQWRFASMAPCI